MECYANSKNTLKRNTTPCKSKAYSREYWQVEKDQTREISGNIWYNRCPLFWALMLVVSYGTTPQSILLAAYLTIY